MLKWCLVLLWNLTINIVKTQCTDITYTICWTEWSSDKILIINIRKALLLGYSSSIDLYKSTPLYCTLEAVSRHTPDIFMTRAKRILLLARTKQSALTSQKESECSSWHEQSEVPSHGTNLCMHLLESKNKQKIITFVENTFFITLHMLSNYTD